MAAEDQPHEFGLGLAMAGAISAGAYSGGVFDFLVQALEAWEDERRKNSPGVPNHRVVLKVMSGASAGAMTGAIGAIELARGLQPERVPDPQPNQQTVSYTLPGLYKAWVIGPRLVAAPGKDLDFLSFQDLQPRDNKAPSANSVLNSTLLDAICEDAVRKADTTAQFPYIATNLHVYLTASNMRGVPYAISFGGEAQGYGMQCHGDRVHYVITGLGTTQSDSKWAMGDAPIHYDTGWLKGDDVARAPWKKYASWALASGAFPIGLAPRVLDANTKDYARYIPIAESKLTQPTPIWPWPGPKDFKFLAVDGGVINNEPFEFARYSLMKDTRTSNPREGAEADCAVVMIEPFPVQPTLAAENAPAPDVLSVAAALLPMLVAQARFKPSELLQAARHDVYSRFLVVPHRKFRAADGEEKDARYAIACGLLSGFGGFLDQEFREHDYQLGRRNCQRFLAEAFALPEDNPIIKAWSDTAKANADCQATTNNTGGKRHYRIIPLLGDARDEVVLPPWPQMTEQAFAELMARINQRVGKLVPVLIDQKVSKRGIRVLLKVTSMWSRSTLIHYVQRLILSDLVRRDQIVGWALPPQQSCDPQDVREVVAELLNPAYDWQTAAAIQTATGIDGDKVMPILKFLMQQNGKKYQVWRQVRPGKPDIYTVDRDQVAGIWQVPGIKQIADFWNAPVIREGG